MKSNSEKIKQLISSRKKNDDFEKASASIKRVMIAKDVIEQIKSKSIIADCVDYFNTVNYTRIGYTKKTKIGLQEILPQIDTCSVCALGGIFYSIIAINNKFKVDVIDQEEGQVNDSLDSYKIKKRIRKLFSNYQMGLIETAFEGEDFLPENCVNGKLSDNKYDELTRAKDFYDIITPDKRIIKIMKNIIKNEGKFKP